MDAYIEKLVAFAEAVAHSQDGNVIAEIGEDNTKPRCYKVKLFQKCI